jgi:hypothetical protein
MLGEIRIGAAGDEGERLDFHSLLPYPGLGMELILPLETSIVLKKMKMD